MMLQGQIMGVPFTLITTGDTITVGVDIVGTGVSVRVGEGTIGFVLVGVGDGVGVLGTVVLVGVTEG